RVACLWHTFPTGRDVRGPGRAACPAPAAGSVPRHGSGQPRRGGSLGATGRGRRRPSDRAPDRSPRPLMPRPILLTVPGAGSDGSTKEVPIVFPTQTPEPPSPFLACAGACRGMPAVAIGRGRLAGGG